MEGGRGIVPHTFNWATCKVALYCQLMACYQIAIADAISPKQGQQWVSSAAKRGSDHNNNSRHLHGD